MAECCCCCAASTYYVSPSDRYKDAVKSAIEAGNLSFFEGQARDRNQIVIAQTRVNEKYNALQYSVIHNCYEIFHYLLTSEEWKRYFAPEAGQDLKFYADLKRLVKSKRSGMYEAIASEVENFLDNKLEEFGATESDLGAKKGCVIM